MLSVVGAATYMSAMLLARTPASDLRDGVHMNGLGIEIVLDGLIFPHYMVGDVERLFEEGMRKRFLTVERLSNDLYV